MTPLADRMRPQNLSQVVGQQHLVSEGKILHKVVQSRQPFSLIFWGPPGSGKTNFCILVSCSQAKKKNKVIYIDTEGGFSSERVKQMAGEGYEEVLGNILLMEPTDFDEQKKDFRPSRKTG